MIFARQICSGQSRCAPSQRSEMVFGFEVRVIERCFVDGGSGVLVQVQAYHDVALCTEYKSVIKETKDGIQRKNGELLT